MLAFPQDVQDLVEASTEAQRYRVGFYLWPRMWDEYPALQQFQWNRVGFTPANAALVPDNAVGLYCFVVEPGIADHPACSFLLYVGKTDQQSLRARYRQYLGEPRKKKGRPHIKAMLYNWREHLYFYYAPVTNIGLIRQLEDDLIKAYLPPMNKTLPASVSRIMGALPG